MNTSDAIAQLERNNDDVALMRVAGSVAIRKLEGEINWVERDTLMELAMEVADSVPEGELVDP